MPGNAESCIQSSSPRNAWSRYHLQESISITLTHEWKPTGRHSLLPPLFHWKYFGWQASLIQNGTVTVLWKICFLINQLPKRKNFVLKVYLEKKGKIKLLTIFLNILLEIVSFVCKAYMKLYYILWSKWLMYLQKINNTYLLTLTHHLNWLPYSSLWSCAQQDSEGNFHLGTSTVWYCQEKQMQMKTYQVN